MSECIAEDWDFVQREKLIQEVIWQRRFLERFKCDLEILDRYRRGEPVEHLPSGIITPGPPGAGKSFATKFGYDMCRKLYPNLNIHITATTGAAASRINGNTLASFLCIGPDAMKMDKNEFIELLKRSRNKNKRVCEAHILIIDEVSMLSQRAFENLNRGLQEIRENPREYGGIYLILMGDPFQLPPVPHDGGYGEQRKYKEFVPSVLERQYPGFTYIVPDKLIRAKDPELADLLLRIVSPDDNEVITAVETLNSRCYFEEMGMLDALEDQKNTGALILCHPKQGILSVEHYNEKSRKDLEETEMFPIRPATRIHDPNDPKLLEIARSRKDISIEEDTITKRDTWPKDPNLIPAIPYIIRYNGDTLEGTKVYNGNTCEVLGHDYNTGITRVRLYGTNEEVTIPRHEFKSEWVSEIGYEAVPLIQASAVTIHKAQGATLSKIILETRSLYPDDQGYFRHLLYTALSRVRCLSDIRLTDSLPTDPLFKQIIKHKINMIWKLPYMKDYPRPRSMVQEVTVPTTPN